MTKLNGISPTFQAAKELERHLLGAPGSADADRMLVAIGDRARAYGISKLAKTIGRRRENLYSALSADGNPSFKDVVRILNVLGFDVTVRSRRRHSSRAHADLPGVISELQSQGITTLRGLAEALTARGVPTSLGRRGWSPTQVSRLLSRIKDF